MVCSRRLCAKCTDVMAASASDPSSLDGRTEGLVGIGVAADPPGAIHGVDHVHEVRARGWGPALRRSMMSVTAMTKADLTDWLGNVMAGIFTSTTARDCALASAKLKPSG